MMFTPQIIFTLSGVIIVLIYVTWVARNNMAWINYVNRKIQIPTGKSISVSVIVAARNEELQIGNLLQSLLTQYYPPSKFQVIISNDFSTDKTAEACIALQHKFQQSGIQFILINPLENQPSGKKAALERAIILATGELILTTDADCIVSPDWIASFSAKFAISSAQMITGFVKLNNGENLFADLQAIDVLSLSGVGATSVIKNKPLMCNGANLAFTKTAFVEAGGYSYGIDQPGGDDTYLMLKINQLFPGKVVFNEDPKSIVTTNPQPNFKHFVKQRIRWASKVKYYNESYVKATGLLIFAVNLVLILVALFALIGWLNWIVALTLWILKATADALFLFHLATFTSQHRLLFVFLPAQILYPFYSLAGTFIAMKKMDYEWKNRNYKGQ
ncbi:MAG: glycosyltransferase [Bacteroidetes bacterium]|nr:glycosyltransferase [Bacteroidota bacterium]